MAHESILAVDDEEDILELLRYNLAKEGYRVTCVASGEEAVKAGKAILPDLILLDLLLPGMDGLEVCRSAQGRGPDPVHSHHHAHRQRGRGGYRRGPGVGGG